MMSPMGRQSNGPQSMPPHLLMPHNQMMLPNSRVMSPNNQPLMSPQHQQQMMHRPQSLPHHLIHPNMISPQQQQQPNHFPHHQHQHHPMSIQMMTGQAKLYPGNQPMIFNPQNPNAPPIHPCGLCRREVIDNEESIMCESGCNFWFHRQCVGLSPEAYALTKREIFAEWACDECSAKRFLPIKIKS